MTEEADKDGFLLKKATTESTFGKKWNEVYVALTGGSLHWYADEDDSKPKRSIEISCFKILDKDQSATEGSTKKLVMTFQNKAEDIVFAFETEEEYNEWFTKIKGNVGQDPKPPLKRVKKMGKMQTLAYKTKKNVGGKVANSSIGKKLIRDNAPEESDSEQVKEMIASIKKMVERESKNPKKGQEMEDNIYKFGVKVYFLIDSGKLQADDLLKADQPVREAFEVFIKCHDHIKYSPTVNIDLVKEKLKIISEKTAIATDILTKLLGAHLKQKNVQMVQDTISYLSDADRLLRIFQDNSLQEEVSDIANAANHYTQFHFYADK
ncbi:hypothetical protein PROFUN_08227 [Planoprotostelium fungivorum]|uniref:PH domain-containing protein n=1 Tax=Planoprotostelium fungivorum TaxID=1890364 RepID=A0A2P6NKA6_9EUKA|nr:hypothetical protein PROFUN_08227 [Planoprotostelium fungivorum]